LKVVGNAGIFSVNGQEVLLRYRGLQVYRTRLRILISKPPQNYCQPQITTAWFPVAPNVIASTLPSAPSPVVNEAPLPPNAILAPEGFDVNDPDLCALFQDLLPVNSAPVFPEEQTIVALAKPYNEAIKAIAIVKAFIDTKKLNYALRLDERMPVLRLRPVLNIITLELAAEDLSLNLSGSDANFLYSKKLKTFASPFVLGRPSAELLKDYVLDAINGFYDINGIADLLIARRLVAEDGSYTLGDGATDARIGIYFTPDLITASVTPEQPSAFAGKSLFSPFAEIQVEALDAFQVGRPRTEAFIPSSAVSITSSKPSVVGGASINAPSASIVTTALLPQVQSIGVEIGTLAPELGASSATTFTGWTRIQNASADDTNINSGEFGFSFKLANVDYTSCFIGSNGYLTFGGGSNISSTINQSRPALPKILFAPGDRSYQRVYTKTETGPNIKYAAIRWEGSSGTSGTPGASTIIVEFRFFELFRDKQWIEIRFGINNATSSNFMIANTTTAYATATSAANSSWVLEGNSTGTSWTMASNRYIGL
jgi:hypothetical protein